MNGGSGMTPGETCWRAFGEAVASEWGFGSDANGPDWDTLPDRTRAAWEAAASAAIDWAIEDESTQMEAMLATLGFQVMEDGHLHTTDEWGCECWGADDEIEDFEGEIH